jgi:hypothetical protein
VCLHVKSIGKPYAGNLHVRFDEGRGGNPRLLYHPKKFLLLFLILPRLPALVRQSNWPFLIDERICPC